MAYYGNDSIVNDVPKKNEATIDPAVGNDASQGYSIGSRWINTASDKEFVCSDATVGAAVWIETTVQGGGSSTWGSIAGTLSNQTDLQSELDGKANTTHVHDTSDITSGVMSDARIQQSNVTQHQAALVITESQVSDLQSYLLNITGESIKSLSDVKTTMAPTDGQQLRWNNTNSEWESFTPIDNDVAAVWGNITGTLSNQTDLQSALDGKANSSHTHVEADITDLQAYLLNITGESIKNLSDVNSSMVPADGQVLTFDTTNGWQAEAIPGGVSDFVSLNDTPANFTGHANKFVKVNVGETALEFIPDPGFLLDITSEPLSDLSDVTITAIADGELLRWNGSAWVNNTLAEAGIEPAFSKNTAFNKNFGSASGDVCEGNDARLSDARTPLAHTHVEADITDLQAYLLDITGEPLSNLSDVTITAIASGEVIKWNGSAWVNNTLAEAGIAPTSHTHVEADITDLQSYLLDITGEDLLTLNDVTITSIADGELLRWNGSAWVNNTLAEAGIEPAFSKNTGFNLDLGTTAGTVSEGNHAHAAADITSGTMADARIAQSNVTQHQGALTITESQISDLSHKTDLNSLDDTTITAAAKGDMLVHNGTAWVDLSVGTDDQVLTADSVEATGVKWADAAGGGGGGATGYHYSGTITTAPAGTGEDTIVIGDGADGKDATDSIYIGTNAKNLDTATASGQVVIGFGANADEPNCISLGRDAVCDGGGGGERMALGYGANANFQFTTAVGAFSTATNAVACAFGRGADATGSSSLALGDNPTASGQNSFAAGASAEATMIDTVAIGYQSDAKGDNAIAIGSFADGTATAAIGIGDTALATGSDAIAIGTTSTASDNQSLAIGRQSIANGDKSTSIGFNALTEEVQCLAIGYETGTGVGEFRSVAVGRLVETSGSDEAVFGTDDVTNKLTLKDTGKCSLTGTAAQFVLPSYTVATLPTGTTGGMILVTDETGGSVPAFYDGTNWRRVTDRAIVA